MKLKSVRLTATEPVTKEVHSYTRRDPKIKHEELIKDLPVREVLCESAPEDLECPRCNSQLKPIGKETVREELDELEIEGLND